MARYLNVIVGNGGHYLGLQQGYNPQQNVMAFPSEEWDRQSIFEALSKLNVWLNLNPVLELDPEVEADAE